LSCTVDRIAAWRCPKTSTESVFRALGSAPLRSIPARRRGRARCLLNSPEGDLFPARSSRSWLFIKRLTEAALQRWLALIHAAELESGRYRDHLVGPDDADRHFAAGHGAAPYYSASALLRWCAGAGAAL
jgi:hypothetical protein